MQPQAAQQTGSLPAAWAPAPTLLLSLLPGPPPTRPLIARPHPGSTADKRYQRADKRDKLPSWISAHLKDAHLNLSTDMLLCIAREFMRAMAQPYDRTAAGRALLSEATVNALDSAAAPPDPMLT